MRFSDLVPGRLVVFRLADGNREFIERLYWDVVPTDALLVVPGVDLPPEWVAVLTSGGEIVHVHASDCRPLEAS